MRNMLVGEDGIGYTEEEFEFLKAIDRYKRIRNRPFPTCCEVLMVLKSLGYAKQSLRTEEIEVVPLRIAPQTEGGN